MLVSVLVSTLCVEAFAEDVSWIPGESSPPGWSVTPANPTTGDVIHFSGPTGTFKNSCVGQVAMGGTPIFTIDQVNKTVELWFQGPPPTICPVPENPVCGLEGSFGPLEAGQWRFFCQHADAAFSILFVVGQTNTSLTYQGRLLDAAGAAEGVYDVQFKLYDAADAGAQQGSTNTMNDVAILGGYFTAVLDFGSDVFNGDPRWLEIGVRPGGLADPNEYTVLSPRQKITPAPYALFALNGGAGGRHSLDAADGDPADAVYVDSDGNVGIGKTTPEAKLEVYGSSRSPIIIGNNTGDGYGLYGLGGSGVYGVGTSEHGSGIYGDATGSYGRGVEGIASNMGDATNYGGQFEARGATGVGVSGVASNPGDARNYGGQFSAEGKSGRGVKGSARGDGGQGVVGYGGAFDFYAEGPGQDYGHASSIRWKSDIRPIDEPLDKVARLRGVYFDWDAEHGGGHDVGMIAEEVGEVLPEIVVYEENGTDAIGLDYSKVTPLLVEAVKALREQKDAEIARLQEQVSDLTTRLERMEAVAKALGETSERLRR